MAKKSTKLDSFDASSMTAQIATILARLEHQEQRHDERMDRQDVLLQEIKVQTTLTNGRVTGLELWRNSYVGRATGIALAASVGASGVAWLLSVLLK